MRQTGRGRCRGSCGRRRVRGVNRQPLVGPDRNTAGVVIPIRVRNEHLASGLLAGSRVVVDVVVVLVDCLSLHHQPIGIPADKSPALIDGVPLVNSRSRGLAVPMSYMGSHRIGIVVIESVVYFCITGLLVQVARHRRDCSALARRDLVSVELIIVVRRATLAGVADGGIDDHRVRGLVEEVLRHFNAQDAGLGVYAQHTPDPITVAVCDLGPVDVPDLARLVLCAALDVGLFFRGIDGVRTDHVLGPMPQQTPAGVPNIRLCDDDLSPESLAVPALTLLRERRLVEEVHPLGVQAELNPVRGRLLFEDNLKLVCLLALLVEAGLYLPALPLDLLAPRLQRRI